MAGEYTHSTRCNKCKIIMIIKMHFENLANKFSFKSVLIINLMKHNKFKCIIRMKNVSFLKKLFLSNHVFGILNVFEIFLPKLMCKILG